MPKIEFAGKNLKVPRGVNLRRALLDAGLSPYNGAARQLNCRGMGSCGTCALEIQGAVSPLSKVEKWRLQFPPHRLENGLRLSCQCEVQGDLKLEKHPGFWGAKLRP